MTNDLSIVYKRPKLYEKQRQFVDCEERYTVVEASTKTGKTVACLVWIFEQALRGKPGQNFWWVAPIYGVAGIAFRRLKRQLLTGKAHPDSWQANETDQTINVGGRVIWFKGADKPDSLYGEDVYAAVVDEASRCKEEAWHALRSTLTATRGRVKIIGNVRGRKNWAYRMGQKAKAAESGYAYFKLTAYDAVEGGVLQLAEVEDAKQNLPESVFKELYLAEPSDDGGNPFGLAAIERCKAPLSAAPVKCFGVDLAKSVDYTALVGLDDAGRVCRLERWQSDWGQTRRRILDLIGDKPALVDQTGVGNPVVEDLRRERGRVEGYTFTAQSKQLLMEGLAAAIQRGEVSFPDGWLVGELEAFEFTYYAGGVRYTAPEGLHDDGVCALALAVQKRHEMRGARIRMVGSPTVAVG